MNDEIENGTGKACDPFKNPITPRTYSTELENTDTFNDHDIFELGFLRSNPTKKIYQHKDKPELFLEECYSYNYSVKDRVVRTVGVYSSILNANGFYARTILYGETKPKKEDIQVIIDTF